MKMKKLLAVSGLVLAVFIAAISETSAQTIYSCYNTKSGAMRHVTGTGLCKKTETEISWQTAGGPKGEKGDKGDTGATGATGLTGATGPQGEPGICSCPPLLVLVTDYQMNEGSGLVVLDSSTYHNDGYFCDDTFTDPYPQPQANCGGVQWGIGVIDFPINQTGGISIGCNGSLQFSTFLKIETVFALHSLHANNYIISKGYLLSSTGSFGLKIDGNSIYAWIMNNGTEYHSISSPVITAGQYYKLVVVYDSAEKVIRLWLNDQEVTYSVQQTVPGDGLIYTGPCSLAAPRHVNGGLVIGHLYGYGTYRFYGTIDYLKLYNKL
jgi:hypothetical protein